MERVPGEDRHLQGFGQKASLYRVRVQGFGFRMGLGFRVQRVVLGFCFSGFRVLDGLLNPKRLGFCWGGVISSVGF